jgi:PP-loop superfamily ATP-utilizing enzyme
MAVSQSSEVTAILIQEQNVEKFANVIGVVLWSVKEAKKLGFRVVCIPIEFYREAGSRIFHRNVNTYLKEYTV